MKRIFYSTYTQFKRRIYITGIEELIVFIERSFYKEIGFDTCIYKDTRMQNIPPTCISVSISPIKNII